MKALTIQQPWAWAIIHAGKDVENRPPEQEGEPQLRVKASAVQTSPEGST